MQLRAIVGSTLNENQLVNNPLLNQVQWNVIFELHQATMSGKYFPLQAVLNRTIVDCYKGLNVSLIIDQLESILDDTDNNRIKKLLFYTGLFNGANVYIESNSDAYLQLVLSFEKFVKNLQIPGATTEVNKIVNKVKTVYHECAKFIVNRPANAVYSIRSRHFKEFLYAANPYNPKEKHNGWRTMPNDKNKSRYRPVFTWHNKQTTSYSNNYKWKIIFENKRFWIRSVALPQYYLDSRHQSHIYLTRADFKLPDLAVWFVSAKRDKNACFIRNYNNKNRFVVAGNNGAAEDNVRRTVFNVRRDGKRRGWLWYIKPYNLKAHV